MFVKVILDNYGVIYDLFSITPYQIIDILLNSFIINILYPNDMSLKDT